MKRILYLIFTTVLAATAMAVTPDSVYVRPYAETHNVGRSGMKLQWSTDATCWEPLCGGQTVLRSDWGSWKTMINPRMERLLDGRFRATWQISRSGDIYASAISVNLYEWQRQHFMHKDDMAVEVHDTVLKVAYSEVQEMIVHFAAEGRRNRLYQEHAHQDSVRFVDLQPLHVTMHADVTRSKSISNSLIGVFFEDLSYAADGGLYAELIQNRDFEYWEREYARNPKWTHDYAWHTEGDASLMIADEEPLHPNNAHYACLHIASPGGKLVNGGFDGIAVRKGERYDFSLYCRVERPSKVLVRLTSPAGSVIAEETLKLKGKKWNYRSCVLTAHDDAPAARLEILPTSVGDYRLDMISLFPQETFMGRKNGLRRDLAQLIADIHPKFIRFPGGCLAHGDGLDNMYDWKGSIGPLYARRHLPNIWHYHQTRGLGYYEYFQFCEDVGAEPLPIIAAGVSCQNSGLLHQHLQAHGMLGEDRPELHTEGQQGGIPMEEMPAYIQDVLDLIEWANGNPRTSKWARLRAEAGHPEPFGLKYIGLGNEDLISEEFKVRFRMIHDAIREHYPEITIIGTVGPDVKGIDYEEGWAFAKELALPVVDEHCYRPTGWFIYNQDFYDKYDRTHAKVYLGEWAARSPGRSQTSLESALAEALHITNLERNGDVVAMASYAPLLAKEGHVHWNPDLIYFDNQKADPTASYYVQRMAGQNSGDEYIPVAVSVPHADDGVRLRIAQSVVRDTSTGDLIVKLVNLLPVDVKVSLHLPPLDGYAASATATLLDGDIVARSVTPVEKQIEAKQLLDYTMPDYSFTVIRIKKTKD